MLGIDRVYLALALVTAVGVGCGGGGNTEGSGGHGGTTSSSSTASSSSSSAASSSSGAPACNGEGTVFAGTKLLFGEGASQWKKFGFNIDGLESTAASNDVCKPSSGGTAGTAYPDGDLGIDNSFGKNLLPTLLQLYPAWVSDVNSSIQNGTFDVLLKMYCLPPTGDAPVLTTKLFGGTSLGSKPAFDGTDKWPVIPELLSNPMDPESSTIIFGQSSVIGTTFDSGKNQSFILTVPIYAQQGGAKTSIKLTLHAAQATMTLAADRKSATAGMIGGVLNTEEFVAEIKKVGFLLNLCNSLLDNLITQIRQASDIMTDGSQDPSKTCDGITMGLGFEMKEAQIGVVGPTTPVGMSCP
jgi:hypothetical protein